MTKYMLPPEILTLARDQTSTKIDQISDSLWYQYMNIIKNDYWSKIVTHAQQNRNWDTFILDSSVANQSEYTLEWISADSGWVKKVTSIWISYTGSTYERTWKIEYKRAREVSEYSLPHDFDYYAENQPQDDPIFIMRDNSYFIAPSPTVWIENWIRVEWIKSIIDYSAATTEEEMVFPSDMRSPIIEWVAALIQKKRSWPSSARFVEQWNFYKQQRDEKIETMKDKTQKPVFLTYPHDAIIWTSPKQIAI